MRVLGAFLSVLVVFVAVALIALLPIVLIYSLMHWLVRRSWRAGAYRPEYQDMIR